MMSKFLSKLCKEFDACKRRHLFNMHGEQGHARKNEFARISGVPARHANSRTILARSPKPHRLGSKPEASHHSDNLKPIDWRAQSS
mmetsp:Transcript_42343/g.75886  ORF Transcript_42343/g.75886 Transcript_42343/m.75886 type:complete len:86 (+) Transcript_42343:3-260(+)